MNEKLKKIIRYKARYRGIKEMDVIVGGFVNSQLDNLDIAQLNQLLLLLDLSDHKLLKLIANSNHSKKPPQFIKQNPQFADILAMIKEFKYEVKT